MKLLRWNTSPGGKPRNEEACVSAWANGSRISLLRCTDVSMSAQCHQRTRGQINANALCKLWYDKSSRFHKTAQMVSVYFSRRQQGERRASMTLFSHSPPARANIKCHVTSQALHTLKKTPHEESRTVTTKEPERQGGGRGAGKTSNHHNPSP